MRRFELPDALLAQDWKPISSYVTLWGGNSVGKTPETRNLTRFLSLLPEIPRSLPSTSNETNS